MKNGLLQFEKLDELSSEDIDSLMKTGFAYIKLPDQSKIEIEKVRKRAMCFFEKSDQEKQKFPLNYRFEGYIDHKYDFPPQTAQNLIFSIDNPLADLTQEKEALDSVSELLKEKIGLSLLKKILARAGLEKHTNEVLSDTYTAYTLVYYPYQKIIINQKNLGLKPHKDWDLITVLLIEKPGLEVCINNEWISVMPKPGYAVINLSNALELITGKRCQAVLHRVNSPENRLTIGLFMGPNNHKPLKNLVTGEILYKTYGHYQAEQTKREQSNTWRYFTESDPVMEKKIKYLLGLSRSSQKYLAIITGRNYSGKTTILNALQQLGFNIIQESALEVIKAYSEKMGTEAFKKWRIKNPEIFQNYIALVKRIQEVRARTGLTFCDRGAYDGIGYYQLAEIEPPEWIVDLAGLSDYSPVFFLNALDRFKLRSNTGRIHNKQQAENASEFIFQTYKKYGYNPILVQSMTIAERVRFIINTSYSAQMTDDSWWAQKANTNLFYLPIEQRPKIVFFYGAKGAGKSTIAKRYCEIDPSSVFLIRSYRAQEMFYNELKEKGSEEAISAYQTLGEDTLYYSQLSSEHPHLQSKQLSIQILEGLKKVSEFVRKFWTYAFFEKEDKATAELADRLSAYGRTVVSDNIFRCRSNRFVPDLSNYANFVYKTSEQELKSSYRVVLVYATREDTKKHIESRNKKLLREQKLSKYVSPEEAIKTYDQIFASQKSNTPKFFKPNLTIDVSRKNPEEIDTILKKLHKEVRKIG